MHVIVACERDVAAWLDLAAEVEPLFSPIVDEPGFVEALRRNVEGNGFLRARGGRTAGWPSGDRYHRSQDTY